MSSAPDGTALRSEDVARRLRAEPRVRSAAQAIPPDPPAWVVGGAVRDAALGKSVTDLDLATAGDPRAAARGIAAAGGGHAFELSAAFETWRAVAREGQEGWQVDVTRLRGDGIAADLALRDFTVGAIAVPLHGGPLLDPHGGLHDLDRRVLRAVAPEAFTDDPLRLLRAARLAAELGLQVDPGTADLARAHAAAAGAPAGERQLAELRLLIGGPDPLGGLGLMDELGITAAVLPELEALRGVDQGPNHHLDVYDHTLAVLRNVVDVEASLPEYAGPRAAEVAALLDEPLADGFTRGAALRLGALLHDIAKPVTAGERNGHVTFIGHDRVGAQTAAGICRRLRSSRRLASHVAALAEHHLRLGFLIHQRPLTPRHVHDYLRATGVVAVDVTLLTVADRLAARGSGPVAGEEMVRAHLALAQEMISAALDWRRDGPPRPLIAGDELAAETGIAAGPRLGEVLAELEAAQYAGEVHTREDAIRHARRAASD